MDGKGRCVHNIFIERLWRSMKYEKIFLEEFETVPELLAGLKEYFEFYNFERPHQSLVKKNTCRDLLGKRSCQDGSMINELKDKQKYTLTHKNNSP